MKDIVKKSLEKGIVKDEINIEKQRRHLKDTHIFGRSFINGDLDFAVKIYEKYKGTGTPIVTNGQWANKERVRAIEVVATYVDENGSEFDSKNIIIIYSKTGSHILGGRPDES